MKFGLNEVYDALVTSLERRKIGVAFFGLLAAFAGALLLSWIAGFAGNILLSVSLLAAAAVFLYIGIGMVNVMTGVIIYRSLTSGERLSIAGAYAFYKKNRFSAIVAPVLAGLIAVAVLLAEYAIFLLARFSAGQVLLSLLSAPFIVLNALIAFSLLATFLLTYAIIVVDEPSAIGVLRKLYLVIKKAPVHLLMYLAPALIIGSAVFSSISGILFVSVVGTLSVFGAASGIFADMAATEVPSLSMAMMVSWSVFSFFVSALGWFIVSYAYVYIKTCAVSIYMSLKEDLK